MGRHFVYRPPWRRIVRRITRWRGGVGVAPPGVRSAGGGVAVFVPAGRGVAIFVSAGGGKATFLGAADGHTILGKE